MNKIDWKNLTFSCVICMLPIIMGFYFYDALPDTLAIHFDINNNADGFASKDFTLFGLPMIMVALQTFGWIMSDLNKKGDKKIKAIEVAKWFIPIVTIIVYTIIVLVGLGKSINVGKVASIILGVLFILTGNYMPKMSYEEAKGNINPLPKTEASYKEMVRTLGYSLVIGGFLAITSILCEGKIPLITILGVCVVVFIESIYYSFK